MSSSGGSRFRRRRRRNRQAALRAVGRCRYPARQHRHIIRATSSCRRRGKGRRFETWLGDGADPPAEKGNAAAVRIHGTGVKRLHAVLSRAGSVVRDPEMSGTLQGQSERLTKLQRAIASPTAFPGALLSSDACRATFHFNQEPLTKFFLICWQL